MARVTHTYTIDEVAKMIGESPELIEITSANSDNIDYGEMIWVDNGTEEGIKTFTDRGIECLQELLADIRTWPGGPERAYLDILKNFCRTDQAPGALRYMATFSAVNL